MSRVARWGPIWRHGMAGTAATTALNVVAYFAARALGAIPVDVPIPPTDRPLALSQVVGTTLSASFAALLIFVLTVLLAKYPFQSFRSVAGVAFVIAIVPPLRIPEAPVAMVATLIGMHLTTALILVGAFERGLKRAEKTDE